MKKLEQLKKLLSNPHISEEMKNKTKEAIEKMEVEEGKKSGFSNGKIKFSVSMGLNNVKDFKNKKEAFIYFDSLTPEEGEKKELHDMVSGKTIKMEEGKKANSKPEDESEDSDWRYDLADMISGGEDPEATKIWKGLSDKKKDEFIKYMHELDTDFSNAGNWENGKRPTLKDSKENVLYLFGENVIEKSKAKKSTKKGKGVKSLLKDKPKKGGTPDNCDEILENLKNRKAQSKKSSKKAAVKTKTKEKAHNKYPELDNLIDSLAGDVTKKIKIITEKVESKMPYKEQYVLEELIKELQSRV